METTTQNNQTSQSVGARFPMPKMDSQKDQIISPPLPVATEPVDQLPTLNDIPAEIIKAGDYHPLYCDKIIEFFESFEMTKTITETLTWKNGDIREIEKEVANPPPMAYDFGRSVGVRVSRLKLWAKKYPEFAEAVDECNEIVKGFIVKNGLAGLYPSQFAIFAAKNLTDMKDKNIVENVTVDINKVLDQIERGTLEIHNGI